MTPWPISMSNILKGQSPSLNQFASHSNFLLKARHQISAIRFKNVEIVAHVFLGCQFLEKYRIIHFYQFLMHQKKKNNNNNNNNKRKKRKKNQSILQ